MINSWKVKSPIRYREHTEQTHKFLLPLPRSWWKKSIRATIGEKKRDQQQQINLKFFTSTVDGMNLLFRCSWEIKIILDLKFFLIGSVYSCFQTPWAGKSIRWNKLACRSMGKKVWETRSTTEIIFFHRMRETYSLWELGQTPLSEKLHNETSVDRLTTSFQNRQRKDCIFLLLKSSKIKSRSNFSLLQLSTALLLKHKKNKISGLYIACTLEDPQAMESSWDKRINLFYRFWEVHSQGEWGQPAEKKTRDQNLMSKSQVITKNVNEKNADFLLPQNSKRLDVKLFSIGSVYSCFQTPRAGKSIRWNKVACR